MQEENVAMWPARCQILNPQPNPQNAMSYTTSAYFGSPRGLVSCCKTYPSKTVTAEVASSSLVVPAILFNSLDGMANSPLGASRGQLAPSCLKHPANSKPHPYLLLLCVQPEGPAESLPEVRPALAKSAAGDV